MKRLKTEELSKLSDADLRKRLNDLRSDLSTLRSKAARGTLKKELGEFKSIKRNIARALTQKHMRMRKKSELPANVAETGTETSTDESEETK